VTLTISAPQGWVVTANPSSLAVSAGASKQAVLYISVPSTASAGTVSITVTGASGSKSHQVTTAVYVAGAPQRLDLAVTTSPSAVSVIRGQTATLTVTVASLGGLSGPVCFSAVVPAGWKFAFNPFSVRLAAGSSGSTTLSLTVPVTALANVYTIKVYGIGNGNSLLRYAVVAVNAQTPQQSQTVPSAPQNLKASAGNGQVTLSWAAPQDNGGSAVTSYRIYRRSAATEEVLLATVSNVLAYTDNGVTNGQTYVYRVTAINSLGESAKSNEATAIPTVPIAGTLNVVFTTDKPTYLRGTFVVIKVTVTDAVTGAAVQGALVSIQIFNPNGTPCGSADLKTSSSGTVLAGAGFSSYAPAGTYTAKVTTSLAGYQSKTQQTTFAMV